jgi:hypothetical protein
MLNTSWFIPAHGYASFPVEGLKTLKRPYPLYKKGHHKSLSKHPSLAGVLKPAFKKPPSKPAGRSSPVWKEKLCHPEKEKAPKLKGFFFTNGWRRRESNKPLHF